MEGEVVRLLLRSSRLKARGKQQESKADVVLKVIYLFFLCVEKCKSFDMLTKSL
jgi:hypothetical protein